MKIFARAVMVGGVAVLAASFAPAADLSVKVVVSEPAGLERKAEPAVGGIPFKKGVVKSVDDLALVDKDGKGVPVQFSKLAGYDDGSVQWALADFLADIPAKGTLELTLKAGKPAPPTQALAIKETDGEITVDAGAAKFTINKAKFSLIETAEVGGKKVAGPGSVDIVSADGKAFAAGKPGKVSWEYKGPMRATLRVDGD